MAVDRIGLALIEMGYIAIEGHAFNIDIDGSFDMP